MSNAAWVVWRIPCSGFRPSSVLPTLTFKPAHRDLRITPCDLYQNSYSRPFSSWNPLSPLGIRTKGSSLSPRCSTPVPSWTRSKRTSAAAKSPKKTSNTLPRTKPVSESEINAIFGQSVVSQKLGNRTLAVLHARRLEGTLDLDLPADITRTFTQSQLDNALEWLRQKYPIDEDAAILARIEREEREAEEKLVRRAEELGLYKPQSGSYEAELGEDKSVYGKSVLKEVREQNEKRLLAEKERKRQEWLAGENEERERLQRQIEGNTALQQYQESGLMEGKFD